MKLENKRRQKRKIFTNVYIFIEKWDMTAELSVLPAADWSHRASCGSQRRRSPPWVHLLRGPNLWGAETVLYEDAYWVGRNINDSQRLFAELHGSLGFISGIWTSVSLSDPQIRAASILGCELCICHQNNEIKGREKLDRYALPSGRDEHVADTLLCNYTRIMYAFSRRTKRPEANTGISPHWWDLFPSFDAADWFTSPACMFLMPSNTHTHTPARGWYFHGNAHERIFAESIQHHVWLILWGLVESFWFQQQPHYPSHFSPPVVSFSFFDLTVTRVSGFALLSHT